MANQRPIHALLATNVLLEVLHHKNANLEHTNLIRCKPVAFRALRDTTAPQLKWRSPLYATLDRTAQKVLHQSEIATQDTSQISRVSNQHRNAKFVRQGSTVQPLASRIQSAPAMLAFIVTEPLQSMKHNQQVRNAREAISVNLAP